MLPFECLNMQDGKNKTDEPKSSWFNHVHLYILYVPFNGFSLLNQGCKLLCYNGVLYKMECIFGTFS